MTSGSIAATTNRYEPDRSNVTHRIASRQCLPVVWQAIRTQEPRLARHDMQQVAVARQLGGPQSVPVAPGACERGLIQPVGGERADPVGVIDQREPVADHRPVTMCQ